MTGQVGTLAALGLLLVLDGCTARRVPVPVAVAADGPRYFVDLQDGWRLRVVTPILKSGGYRVKAEPSASGPDAATLSVAVGSDFLGYEVAYYAVGSRVTFTSAEVHRQVDKKDTVTAEERPLVLLFQLPHGARYVRLIYLVRVSEADHDMAVVAARNKEELDPLTAQVRANPSACRNVGRTFCSWIPDGIAVTPERKVGEEWAPAS